MACFRGNNPVLRIAAEIVLNWFRASGSGLHSVPSGWSPALCGQKASAVTCLPLVRPVDTSLSLSRKSRNDTYRCTRCRL